MCYHRGQAQGPHIELLCDTSWTTLIFLPDPQNLTHALLQDSQEWHSSGWLAHPQACKYLHSSRLLGSRATVPPIPPPDSEKTQSKTQSLQSTSIQIQTPTPLPEPSTAVSTRPHAQSHGAAFSHSQHRHDDGRDYPPPLSGVMYSPHNIQIPRKFRMHHRQYLTLTRLCPQNDMPRRRPTLRLLRQFPQRVKCSDRSSFTLLNHALDDVASPPSKHARQVQGRISRRGSPAVFYPIPSSPLTRLFGHISTSILSSSRHADWYVP